MVVHCSGGTGRTGTFIAVSVLLERLKAEGVVDVFHTVRALRLQRPAMVQTVVRIIIDCIILHLGMSCMHGEYHNIPLTHNIFTQDQYEFVYKTILEYLDSFELYANFK